MRLIQLKLSGFKSFVDPTVVPISSNMVGVVGPNGCGKSNIIDAVRWVLGETKASELRGESMQDVIFNGSGQRKPSNRASVELVFDNSDGRVLGQWSTYAEISVRRVLTRDGTSSYYINNQLVRRRDIHDIFMGTGLGARGYAIIGQGMINRLIEAKPEELRVYLEEAAGVSRYKERRRETENRLADTHENLTRVEDILRELDTQLKRLEAQAEVAQKYHALQEEGQEKQHVLWYVRERQAKDEAQQKNQAIQVAQTALEENMATLRSHESKVETHRQAHYQASDAVHAAQTALYEANSQVTHLESEIRHVVDSRQRLQQRKAQLNQQWQEWQDQIKHCDHEMAQTQEELEITAAQKEEAMALVDEKQNALPDLEQQVKQAQQGRESMRVSLSAIEQKLALLSQQESEANRQLQVTEQRHDRLLQEKAQVQSPDKARLEQLNGDEQLTQGLLEEAQGALITLEERLPDLETARQTAQQESQQAQNKVARLEARLVALQTLQEDVMHKGALEPWLKKHELDSLGRLWQKVHVDQGWEIALESVLRERLNALELRDLGMAQAFENDPPPSRLTFFQTAGAMPLPTAPAGFKPLIQLVRCTDPQLKSVLAQWLANTFVVETVQEALAQRQQLPEQAQFVVKQGHLVDAFGISFYAADTEQAGMLARQQEIENVQREFKAASLIADQLVSSTASAESAWQATHQAMVPARQRLSELTTRLHDIQLERNQLAQQLAQADQLGQRIQDELSETQSLMEELTAKIETVQQEFETLDEQLAVEQENFAQAQMTGENMEQQTQNARQAVQQAEQSVREIEFEARRLQSRLGELQRNQQLAQQQSDHAKLELENLEGELFEYDEQAIQAGLQEALENRAIKEEALQQARLYMDNVASQLKTTDEDRLRAEHAIQPQRDAITDLQLKAQAAQLAVEQFAEQLNANEVDRDALASSLQERSSQWQDVAWLQAEVQRISKRIDALGLVNLAALEELNQAQERKAFLDAQQNDLLQAIHTLEEAIRKIDRETRELLQDTFNQVNGHFGDLFPRLFGGGEARLRMTGDEILDAGVQVMAQPPGKKNSTIHLLSGGEKALTATALVFALFKLNPAPFCLLDEVDAPLDDANTERYANLVNAMSEQTQFIFISHNKIAMQMARQLIGVTMQEQGVSRIVAVDIDAAVKLAGDA